MKIKFWLLDINPRIEDGKPVELWLWGIDAHGNRVLTIDRNFAAYFYIIVKEGFDSSLIAKQIMELCGLSIVKTKTLERRFFGKPVQAIKVYCKVATETGKLARQLRGLEAVQDCLEDDIRIPMQYLIDNDVAPCAWHEVDVQEEASVPKVRVDMVYSACSVPKKLFTVEKPALRTLSFSMVSYSREGSPKPDRNPVVVISTASSNGEEKQFVAGDDKNDQRIIEQFVQYLRQCDPDVILSFGGNTRHWEYLTKR
ncbi:MAG: 3'-5' exonuclease, partial [Candidatus Bathyarchaeia archaeon]